MSDTEPIRFSPRSAGSPATGSGSYTGSPAPSHRDAHHITAFHRTELSEILAVYGRKVAAGEWRDYAIDMGRETAVFSVFRRTSEHPLYRIEKTPKLARRQGAFSVVAAGGVILKRGHDLARVLQVLEKRLRVVD